MSVETFAVLSRIFCVTGVILLLLTIGLYKKLDIYKAFHILTGRKMKVTKRTGQAKQDTTASLQLRAAETKDNKTVTLQIRIPEAQDSHKTVPLQMMAPEPEDYDKTVPLQRLVSEPEEYDKTIALGNFYIKKDILYISTTERIVV